MSWWPYITAAGVGVLGLNLAALTFVSAYLDGWNAVRGTLLFFQGGIVTSAICNVFYVISMRRARALYREQIREAYENVPVIVTKILHELQERGLVHPELEFSEMVVSDDGGSNVAVVEDGPRRPPPDKRSKLN